MAKFDLSATEIDVVRQGLELSLASAKRAVNANKFDIGLSTAYQAKYTAILDVMRKIPTA